MSQPDTSPSVVIADDQPLMRAAIRSILEADGIHVVAEAKDGAAAIDACERLRPDVVLMDVRMPVADGLTAAAALTRHRSPTRVLVLTTFDDDETLFGALKAGAAGFMLKNAPPEELQQAVRAVSQGESVLDGAVLSRVMARFAEPSASTERLAETRADDAAVRHWTHLVDQLTEREKDVLFLLVAGLSNAEIAGHIHIGEATAKTHVSHVILKLGVRDRLQAVILAYESGFARKPRTVQSRTPDGAAGPAQPDRQGWTDDR